MSGIIKRIWFDEPSRAELEKAYNFDRVAIHGLRMPTDVQPLGTALVMLMSGMIHNSTEHGKIEVIGRPLMLRSIQLRSVDVPREEFFIGFGGRQIPELNLNNATSKILDAAGLQLAALQSPITIPDLI